MASLSLGFFVGAVGLVGLALHAPAGRTASPPNTEAATLSKPATELLQTKCVACHGAAVKSGGIDLSSGSAAVKTGALTPGDAETSKLVRLVRAGKMPPTGKLPDEEIALLERWVRAGAAWPAAAGANASSAAPLWSLKPVRRPAPPRTPFDSLARNPIDRFIFARLAEKGLRPSAPSGKRELLRRVSIDLTGLPPTPEQIAAFIADTSPNAYEKVVDRLLASPAYGERWGRHWLDVVRYGESSGYEQNHLRPNAWPYRDYVIRAFNEDKPYTRFIAEQLAGDVLSRESPEAAAATGFLVAGIHDTVTIQTEEGTLQQRSNDLDDIVSTTGAAFLGLTVGCAKCHDHKFDPIPQKDYYRLTACFAGVRHGERSLATPEEQAKADKETAAQNRHIQALANEINDIDAQAREVVLRRQGKPVGTRPAVNARRNVDDFPPVEARFVRFTILATNDGTEPCLDELQVFGADGGHNLALAQEGAKATASSLLPGVAIHRIPHLNDGLLGNEHSWISNTRGAGWARIELLNPAKVRRVVWSRDGAAIPRFDDRLPTAYRVEVSLDGADWQTVSTQAGRTGSNGYIHPDLLRQAMTPDQRARRESLAKERTTLEAEEARRQSGLMAYVGQFGAPDPTFVLRRGDVMQRIEPAPPGALSCVAAQVPNLALPNAAPEPERRLALAKWIADSRNPLTARVMVNRIWQYHFGRGLVSTPSDFGRNGERPTHPELLDWLASEFMHPSRPAAEQVRQDPHLNPSPTLRARDHTGSIAARKPANETRRIGRPIPWTLKSLHRLIVTSYTYRQASAANPKGLATDAGDQLLWRMPLRRLEAEAIRDAILQAGGKLDRRMGGPGYALFQYNVVNVAIYSPLENYGPQTWRRSVYQQAARSIHDEILSAFDCPESSQRAPRRESTTTALQALNLLNGPFIRQQSGFLADRVRKEAAPNPVAQTGRAFLLTLGRPPNADERKAALSLLTAEGLPSLCRVLMNTNEFLYY